MRETSLLSYGQIMERETELTQIYQSILSYLTANPSSTDYEITRGLNFSDPNKVRPRRNELVKFGLIVDKGIKICEITHRKAHCWNVGKEMKR
jgi:hypothetical protein